MSNLHHCERSHMLLVWQWIPKVAWSSDWLLQGQGSFFIFLYFDKKNSQDKYTACLCYEYTFRLYSDYFAYHSNIQCVAIAWVMSLKKHILTFQKFRASDFCDKVKKIGIKNPLLVYKLEQSLLDNKFSAQQQLPNSPPNLVCIKYDTFLFGFSVTNLPW